MDHRKGSRGSKIVEMALQAQRGIDTGKNKIYYTNLRKHQIHRRKLLGYKNCL